MVLVPSSCALLGGFAIGAQVLLLWQHNTEAKCQRVLVLALCLVVYIDRQKSIHLVNLMMTQWLGLQNVIVENYWTWKILETSSLSPRKRRFVLMSISTASFISQPLLTLTVQAWQLSLFGHIAQMNDGVDVRTSNKLDLMYPCACHKCSYSIKVVWQIRFSLKLYKITFSLTGLLFFNRSRQTWSLLMVRHEIW